jgi:integrase
VYALAVYLYARINEIRAIGLEDIDPEHDLVHVHRAIDKRTKLEKSTKAGRPRRMPIEPNVALLVRILYAEAEAAGRSRLVVLAWSAWPKLLRADLLTAGVTRAELHAGDASRQPLRFHDLRATGITWAGIRGDDPLKIRQRAGHAKFSTTEGYLRTAEDLSKKALARSARQATSVACRRVGDRRMNRAPLPSPRFRSVAVRHLARA